MLIIFVTLEFLHLYLGQRNYKNKKKMEKINYQSDEGFVFPTLYEKMNDISKMLNFL